MIEILGFIAFIILIQFIAGPVLVRFTMWARKQPTIAAIDLVGMPQPIAEVINTYRSGIENAGFKMVETFALPDFMPNLQVISVLFLNSRDKTWAMIAIIVALNSDQPTNAYIEFCTEYSDETETCTNNSKELQAFGKIPGKRIFQFPMVTDATLLYRVHNHLQQTNLIGGTAILNGVGEEAKYMEASVIKDFMQQEKLGYYYLDSSDEKYRPTWKGAILMTWKLAWPIGMFRKILMRQKEKRKLREIGSMVQY